MARTIEEIRKDVKNVAEKARERKRKAANAARKATGRLNKSAGALVLKAPPPSEARVSLIEFADEHGDEQVLLWALAGRAAERGVDVSHELREAAA